MGAEFQLSKNASSEAIRQQLRDFGRFSEIDISVEKGQGNDEQIVIFREIGLGQRLQRFLFEDKKTIEESRKKSQQHLIDLAKNRPDIKKLLGNSIIENKFWVVGDFREKLKIQTSSIRRDTQTDKFQIPENSTLRCGVTDASVSEVKADTYVHWNFHSNPSLTPVAEKEVADKNSVTVTCDYRPDKNQLRAAYRIALSNASGHLVLSPINDVPLTQVKEQYPDCAKAGIFDLPSDMNLRILLEEIDQALNQNKNLAAVTIARDNLHDQQFLSRVLAQRAMIDKEKELVEKLPDKKHAAMPEGLRLIEQSDVLVKAPEDDLAKLKTTALPNVFLYQGDPAKLSADTTFMSSGSLDQTAQRFASDGMKQLRKTLDLINDPSSVVSTQANDIMSRSEDLWGVLALELPPGEIPTNKLYSMRPGASDQMTEHSLKIFFKEHLQNLTGRVVIEVPDHEMMAKALWSALEELAPDFEKSRLECILASPGDLVITRFIDADDINPQDFEQNLDEESFDYLANLQLHRRH